MTLTMISFIDFHDSLYDDAVSGVGLLKHCNKRFRATHDSLYHDEVVENGDVWFVKRDYLEEFFRLISAEGVPSISVVTQHSDYELGENVMQLKPKCVTKVFGPNNTCNRIDSIPIPLGLGPPFGRGAPLADDIKNSDTRRSRSRLLYVNFRPHTYSSERLPLMDHFVKQQYSWATVEPADSTCLVFDRYLSSLTEHKFSLCPRGNGIDTHRLWESLYARTVPVVKYCEAHRNFLDLPILFVNDWSDVTEDFLNKKYQEMSLKKWDYSKMRASWWSKQFRG